MLPNFTSQVEGLESKSIDEAGFFRDDSEDSFDVKEEEEDPKESGDWENNFQNDLDDFLSSQKKAPKSDNKISQPAEIPQTKPESQKISVTSPILPKPSEVKLSMPPPQIMRKPLRQKIDFLDELPDRPAKPGPGRPRKRKR